MTPSAGSCAIDHSSINWDEVDVTGGFGSSVKLSYDNGGFYGVNFFKADNSTPLGLQNTCSSCYSSDFLLSGNLWTDSFIAPDTTNPGSYKTIFGGWWGDS